MRLVSLVISDRLENIPVICRPTINNSDEEMVEYSQSTPSNEYECDCLSKIKEPRSNSMEGDKQINPYSADSNI